MKKTVFKTVLLTCWECKEPVNKVIKFENGYNRYHICEKCLQKAIQLIQNK